MHGKYYSLVWYILTNNYSLIKSESNTEVSNCLSIAEQTISSLVTKAKWNRKPFCLLNLAQHSAISHLILSLLPLSEPIRTCAKYYYFLFIKNGLINLGYFFHNILKGNTVKIPSTLSSSFPARFSFLMFPSLVFKLFPRLAILLCDKSSCTRFDKPFKKNKVFCWFECVVIYM